MSIVIGLDFGSRNYHAAYVLGDQIVAVPAPPAEQAWFARLVIEPAADRPPLGIAFSSLKHQLGSGERLDWGGAPTLTEDALRGVFTNIKRTVETFAGDRIGRTVVSVPSRYSARRRAIVREAGEAAGFGQVDLINDCTAAVLGRTHGQEDRPRTVLVYSVGFTGFEVSVLRYARRELRELLHDGGRAPSGRDIDLEIVAGLIDSLRRSGVPFSTTSLPVLATRFFLAASEAKEQFSISNEPLVHIQAYVSSGARHAFIPFYREQFDTIITTLMEPTFSTIRRVLDETDMTPEDIDDVLLVGGTTRIGVIQRKLEEMFGDKIVPYQDDLLARGAAVRARRLEEEAAGRPPEPASPAEIVQPDLPSARPSFEHAPVPVPEASDGVSNTGDTAPETATTAAVTDTTPTDNPPTPVTLPARPSLDAVFAHANQLVVHASLDVAMVYLEDVERRCRELRHVLAAQRDLSTRPTDHPSEMGKRSTSAGPSTPTPTPTHQVAPDAHT